MTRGVWLVLAAKTTRSFCYGFLGVLLPLYLINRGLEASGLGLAVSLTLLSSAGLTLLVRRPAERHGPRMTLMALAVLIVVSALLFLGVEAPWLVVLAAMLGNLAVGTGETGAFLALEQVLITRASASARLTGALSLYNLAGYVAAALGAGFVGLSGLGPTALFWIFLAGGIVQILAYAGLDDDRRPAPVRGQREPRPSTPLVRRVAALFALDSLAGGFVIQSLVTYWFHTRFGLDLAALGWVLFGAQMLSGLSLLLAAWLAPRLGLVNTMVFSHLISNLFLIGIALSPTAGIAAGLLLARHLLSQMDVPTRQSFLMLAVKDHEREAAATLTNMSRTFAQAASPAATGWIMQTVALSVPFMLGGALKIVYDLMLYATIRHVRVPEPRHGER